MAYIIRDMIAMALGGIALGIIMALALTAGSDQSASRLGVASSSLRHGIAPDDRAALERIMRRIECINLGESNCIDI